MKKNKILLVVILSLVIIAGLLLTGQHYSTLKKQESDFTVRDTAAVMKIFMADQNNHSMLLQRTDKGWYVDKNIKASNREVEFMLSTLRRLRVKAPVSLASFNNVVKRLSSISVKVEIYQRVYRIRLGKLKLFPHVKRTKVFYVGDVTQNNLGTYMLIAGAKRPYIVYIPGFRGFVSSRFSPLINDWRSHILFHKKLADIKSVSVEFGDNRKGSFRVEVEDVLGNYDFIRLKDNSKVENYDTLKILNFLTSFRDLRYESRLNGGLPKKEIDSIIKSPFLYRLCLVDNDFDTTILTMFKKNRFPDEVNKAYDQLVPVDLDRFYGYTDNNDFVLMQHYTFDKVLHPLSYYVRK